MIKRLIAGLVMATAIVHAEVRHIKSQVMMDDLIKEAKKDNKSIVIDFFAEWCGPCKMMAAVYERLADVLKDTCVFIKIDVDKLKTVAEEYTVTAMPTVVVLKDGKEAGRFVGSKTYTAMKKDIEAFIK